MPSCADRIGTSMKMIHQVQSSQHAVEPRSDAAQMLPSELTSALFRQLVTSPVSRGLGWSLLTAWQVATLYA
jgi:hypothetical protein